MATKVLVNGKFETRAGVYATVKSGIVNPVANQPFSNILIIDDGIGAGNGGGSGINGYVKNGADAVYQFNSLQDFRAFVKGGELWKLGSLLFNPSQKFSGVSNVFLVQAKTSAPAIITVGLTNGAFVIQTNDEGLNANGVLANGLLSTGIAAQLLQVNIPSTTATFVSSVVTAQGVSTRNVLNFLAAGINIGDVFNLTIAGVLKTVTASSTLPSILYSSFAALFNADSTVSPLAVATVTPTGLVLTAVAVNVAITATSTATPATPSFVFQIWHGSFKGIDPINNVPYDNIAVADAKPVLMLQSPIISQVSDLITWFNTNSDFKVGFSLKAGATAAGNIVLGDIATYPSYILATGGTESYASTDFDAALTKINNLDFTHILACQYGASATGLNNTKLFQFVTTGSKYDRILVLAGGFDQSAFNTGTGSSVNTSAYYNSDKVVVVHGGIKKSVTNGTGFLIYSQLHHAAVVLGRCAGLEPQVPVTLKSIGVDGLTHLMSDDEQVTAIAKGVMYSYFDYEFQKIVAGQDVNSLQKNDYLVNDDGTSFNWALKRITAALNKGIVVAGKVRFFGDYAGQNRNTSSPAEVVVWAKGFLDNLVATDNKDNLLIRYQDVAASISQDNLFLTYKFVGNTEVSKIISTGTIIAN